MLGGPSSYPPPPVPAPPRPAPLAALVGAVCVLSGCLASGGTVRAPGDVRADPAAVAATRDSLSAAGGLARQAVAVRALRRGGVTPLAGGLLGGGVFTRGVGAPVVAGFVPGRVPGRASELVVVAASLDDPAAAAEALEAARVLVDLSLVRTVPERTVEVALWSGLDVGGGVEAVLRSPVWPRDAVAAVLVVGDRPAPPARVGGVAVTAVAADRPALAARIVEAALALAAEPPAIPPPAP